MTPKTIYLHIGRHKTGTSSIQHFISHNPDVLSDLNLYYPRTGNSGIAHHLLAQTFANQKNKTTEAMRATEQSDTVRALLEEIDSQPNNILISSEGFQNSNPHLIKSVFKQYDIRIFVYIRNQIDYLASSYAQRVWATRYSESMEHYYDNVFRIDYFHFLNNWQAACDGNITTGIFSRDTLFERDVVADFFANMIGEKSESLIKRILERGLADANPSLTADLLAYKLKFNASNIECHETQERWLRMALANLSLLKGSKPVRVTPELKQFCIEKCQKINEMVSDKFFDGTELFSMDRPTGQPSILSDELAEEISQQLIASDPRIKDTVLRFHENMHPIQKAG